MDQWFKDMSDRAREFGATRASMFQQQLDRTKQQRRESLILALHDSRRACRKEGHDWDIADVMKVLDQEGLL